MSYVGYPDHDYVAENRKNYAWHFVTGYLDAVNAVPNNYLYYFCASSYQVAAGYRDGYNSVGPFKAQGKVRMTYAQHFAVAKTLEMKIKDGLVYVNF